MLNSTSPRSKLAFSLVELSIVLVILGLLVGGILAGKSLIHAAELRSVSRDFQKYHAAVMSFRDKYFYLPGDITNATSFWGVAGGTGLSSDTACSYVVSTGTETCNGDGNGMIDINSGGLMEGFRAWQHLGSAGLVEGQFSGSRDTVTGFSPAYITRGLNVPAGRIANSAFVIGYGGGVTGIIFKGPPVNQFSGQFIMLLKPLSANGTGGVGGTVFWGAISHEDAWNLDTKMDDGVAGTGKVRADISKFTGTQITNMTCMTYDLTNSTDTCALGYIFGN